MGVVIGDGILDDPYQYPLPKGIPAKIKSKFAGSINLSRIAGDQIGMIYKSFNYFFACFKATVDAVHTTPTPTPQEPGFATMEEDQVTLGKNKTHDNGVTIKE